MVAYWCRHAPRSAPARSGIPMYLPGEIDWHVMLISAGICLMATLVLGLVPAFQARDIDLAGALKAESSNVTSARRRAWMRSGLVVFQVFLELYFVGWSRATARESAKDSNRQPRLLHNQGTRNGRAARGRGI